LFAEVGGMPLAGIFLLHWQNVAYYKFNASLDQRFRPNDLLVWKALLHARQLGVRMFDFGLSDSKQLGLLRFKRKFAAEERDIYFLEWKPDVSPDHRRKRATDLLHHMTHMFTHPSVPDEITWEAGEKFYRFFA
jgi:hypothetical protein